MRAKWAMHGRECTYGMETQCQRSETTPAKSSGSGRKMEAGRLIGVIMSGFGLGTV